MADKIIFEVGTRFFGLDTANVDRILEVEKFFFLPGQSAFINGVISLSGEPVAVVSVRRILGEAAQGPGQKGSLHKVIVLRDKTRRIGFDIGSAEISFLWEEEAGEKIISRSLSRDPGGFICGSIDTREAHIELLDWGTLFEEAKRILSTDGTGG